MVNLTIDIADAIILNPLGTAKNDADYEAAKAGNVFAACRLAKKLVSPNNIAVLLKLIKSADIVIGVTSIEQLGENALADAAAILIAEELALIYDENIVQQVSPKRTNMNGLDRLFNRPIFDGEVKQGANYILIDDTITQGGTFAALSAHIASNNGKVFANIALTGKQYSSKIKADIEAVRQVREKFGDIENEFRKITRYGYDELTHSEIRYITLGIAADTFRNRVTAESKKATGDTNT